MSKRLVVIGSSNTDLIMKLPRLPAPGETVTSGEFSTAAGGKGANQAVAAARAGGDVIFIARVGDDDYGRAALENYRADRIDVSFVRSDPAPSGMAFIFVDKKGENMIAVAPGANLKLSPSDIDAAEEVIADSAMILIQLEIPLDTVYRAVTIAAKHKVPVMLNPAPARELSDELLKKISIITPNQGEVQVLTGIKVENEKSAGKAADRLLGKGVGAVLITMGTRGAFVADKNQREVIPAFEVDAVDATAAGDVFNGALAVKLIEGAPLLEAVKFASAAAALSVTRMGAQTSIPFREEIELFLKR